MNDVNYRVSEDVEIAQAQLVAIYQEWHSLGAAVVFYLKERHLYGFLCQSHQENPI